MVSTSAISAGATVLLECRPLAAAVHYSRTLQACATCMSLRLGEVSTKFLAQPIVCPVCAQACWCSEECRNHSQVGGAHPAQLCFAYKKLGEMAAAAQAKAEAAKGGDKAQAAQQSNSDSTNVLLDEEALTDARLLFYAYLYRRYRPEEFHKWSLLCSPPEEDESEVFAAAAAKKANGASASSSAAAAVSPKSSLPPSPKTVAEEARIEQLHDVVVECLQYAADSIAAPTPNPVTPAVATPPDADAESDPLAMPTLGSPAAAAATVPAAAAAVTPVASPSSQLPPPPLALPRLSKQFTDLHISHPSDDLTSSLALDADLAVTRALYLKAQCNGFALAAPHDKLGNRQTPRGYALYSAAAMFNHSCMPNVARFDKIDCRDVKFVKKGAATPAAAPASSSSSSSSSSSFGSSGASAMSPTSPGAALPSPSSSDCPSSSGFTPLALELRAMHAIPPYTELTLSYVPLFWERRDRRSHLRDEYAFRCRCARCLTEKEWEREERLQQGDEDAEEHDHKHDHDDEDEDEEGEDDGEDGEDDEDAASDEDESESDDEAADSAAAGGEERLGRGELNVYCMKYICPSKTCGGTMAPIQAGSAAAATAPPLVSGPQGAALGGHMECNVCGKMRTDAQFAKQLQKEFGLRNK